MRPRRLPPRYVMRLLSNENPRRNMLGIAALTLVCQRGLGHSLVSVIVGVLGHFTTYHQNYCCVELYNGRPLGQLAHQGGCLIAQPFKHVHDKRVYDCQGLAGRNYLIRVHLPSISYPVVSLRSGNTAGQKEQAAHLAQYPRDVHLEVV